MTSTMTLTEAKNHFQKYRSSSFRDHQERAIQFILDSKKKFIFIEAPTGSGKTLLGMVSGILHGGVTYSVHTKTLQNQVTTDHPEAISLFGRSNYSCLSANDMDCSECFHTKDFPCYKKSDCLYEIQKNKVLASQLRILNFSYLLAECNFVGKFSGSSYNVVDEADSLEDTLVNFTSLTFTRYGLSRLGLADHLTNLHKTSKYPDQLLESWKEFGSQASLRAKSIISKLSQTISTYPKNSNPSSNHLSALKERTRIIQLQEKIKLFTDNVDPTWKLDDSQDGRYTFRPLWLTESLAEQFMWRHSAKWCLMSASFLPIRVECHRLGIPLDEVDYLCLPSTFPVDHRRVIFKPVANLVWKEMDSEIPKAIEGVKQILAHHPTERGIIHAVSFKLAKQVYEGVNSPRLMIHDSSNKQEVLDSFIDSGPDSVIISPSLARGVSLDFDKARFQIIIKMPYMSLGDKIVQARVYSGPLGQAWFSAAALLTILQMAGRIVRSKDDFGITYVIDMQAKKAVLRNPAMLPEWFRDAIEFS